MPHATDSQRAAFGRADALCLAALLTVAATLLWPSLSNGFYDDDFRLLQRCAGQDLGTVVREDLFGFRTNFWRPGWYLLWQLAYSCFGTAPTGYFALAIGLHLLLGAALFLTLRLHLRAALLPSLAGAASYALGAGILEGVLWPAAAFNVLPAAALLLVATLATMRAVFAGSVAAYALALCAAGGSLLFREAAYQMPLVWLAAVACLPAAAGVRRPVLWLGVVPFAALVLLHHTLLNRAVGTGLPPLQLATYVADLGGLWAADLFALPLRGVSAWWLAAPLFVFAFATGSPRARCLLLCTFAAAFPYVLKAHSSRFVLLAAVPAALWIGAWLHDVRGRVRALPWLAVLTMLIAHAAVHRDRQAYYRGFGEGCRALLASSRQLRLHEAPMLALDRFPIELRNGLGPMLDLELGREPPIREMLLLPRPPLLVHVGFAPESLPDGTVFVRYIGDIAPPQRRFEIVPRDQLGKGLVPMFVVSVAQDIEIVPDAATAQRRIASGETDPRRTTLLVGDLDAALPEAPDARIAGVQIDGTTMTVDVEAKTAFLLVVCHALDLTTVKARVEADDEELRIRQANGVANAVLVPAGARRVRITLLPP